MEAINGGMEEPISFDPLFLIRNWQEIVPKQLFELGMAGEVQRLQDSRGMGRKNISDDPSLI